MTATATDILMSPGKTIRFPQLTLKSGQHVYANTGAAIELSSGKCVSMVSGNTGLKSIGIFTAEVDAALGDTLCVVDLCREVVCVSMRNDTGTAVTLVGSTCYMLDNQTVTGASSGNAIAGTVWEIDATDGVLYEPASNTTVTSVSYDVGLDTTSALFAANDWAPAASALSMGKTYVIGSAASAAAHSTVSLPAAGVAAGFFCWFVADGTQGAYTITYRDATTARTTALTASKPHVVRAINVGNSTTSVWAFSAYANA
jgi:hypothetical protein